MYQQDKGWGRPGSKNWHENNLKICTTSAHIIQYLEELLGDGNTKKILRKKALEMILEAMEKGDI